VSGVRLLADTGVLNGEKMFAVNKVLLASHGTDGALHHLVVVPTFWEGTTGDDWLQNGAVRNDFRRYLEGELGREVDENFVRVGEAAVEKGLNYTNDMVVGEPDEVLLASCEQEKYDLVIMGSIRPKKMSGLRSRMLKDKMVRQLKTPLLVVPFPDE
jgi:nucleotide-binding universal stress UspA family protein